MAIDKIQSESINLADTFAFTGTVTGAGGTNTPAPVTVPVNAKVSARLIDSDCILSIGIIIYPIL